MQKNLSAFTHLKKQRTNLLSPVDRFNSRSPSPENIYVSICSRFNLQEAYVCGALEMCYGVWLCVYSSCVNQLEANKSRVVMLCGNSREGSQKGSDASLFVSLWWETINNKQPVSERTPRFRPQLRTAILSRLQTQVADTEKKAENKIHPNAGSECFQETLLWDWTRQWNLKNIELALFLCYTSILRELKPTDSRMPM